MSIVNIHGASQIIIICTIISAHIHPRQIQTPHHQFPAALDLEQAVRPAADDFRQVSLSVWNASDIQRAGDDDLTVEDAIAGDLDAAAGGDGASGLHSTPSLELGLSTQA